MKETMMLIIGIGLVLCIIGCLVMIVVFITNDIREHRIFKIANSRSSINRVVRHKK